MKELFYSGVLIVIISAFTMGDTASAPKKEESQLPQNPTTEEIIHKTELYKRTERIEKTLDSLGYAS